MANTNYSATTGSTTTPLARTPYVKPPTLYRPGMTAQQFQQALAADPGYQAILRNPANRAPNGQLTPQGWNAANQYAQDAGLGEDGLNGEGRTNVAGAFHGGGSRYSVDGNGNVTESHDSWVNPETLGAVLGMGIGGAVAAPYVAGAVGASGGGSTAALGPSTAESMAATSAAASSAPAGIAAGTLGSTVTGGGLATAAGKFLMSQGGTTALSTAGNVFSNIYGANKQADANKYGADLQDAATQRAEQFAREQAEGAYQSSEHTQHANYDQWRARQDAIMGSLGRDLGINYTAPEYSPGIDPRYTGGATTPTGTAPASGDPAQAFIANWQRTHDPKEGIEPLAQAYKAAGFGDRFLVNGTTPSNNELVVGGQKYKVLSGENGASPSWYVPGTNDGGVPVARPSLATTFVRPNFIPQQTPYRPGTLGAYVGS